MIKYLLEHEKKLNDMLLRNLNVAEVNAAIKENLHMIQFMQHERLIHLIVTVTFSVLLIITFLCAYIYEKLELVPLAGLFLVLEIPYVFHYYKLENCVQRLYTLHDKMTEKSKEI